MKTRRWLSATLAVVLFLAAAPLMAEERLWQVKGFGLFIAGGSSANTSHDDHDWVTVDGEYGGGLYAAIEYRPTPRLGIEMGNLVGAVGTSDSRYGCCGGGSVHSTAIGFSSLLLALDVHLITSRRIDVSLGPIVGYSWFSELDYDSHEYHKVALALEDDFIWGGGLDIDIRVAESNWSIAITAKYLDSHVESSRHGSYGGIDASFDPFMIGVGFGFEF